MSTIHTYKNVEKNTYSRDEGSPDAVVKWKKKKKEKKNKRETNKDLSPSALPKPYHSSTRFGF